MAAARSGYAAAAAFRAATAGRVRQRGVRGFAGWQCHASKERLTPLRVVLILELQEPLVELRGGHAQRSSAAWAQVPLRHKREQGNVDEPRPAVRRAIRGRAREREAEGLRELVDGQMHAVLDRRHIIVVSGVDRGVVRRDRDVEPVVLGVDTHDR